MRLGISLLAALLASASCSSSSEKPKPKPPEPVVFDAAPAFSIDPPAGWTAGEPRAGEQARWVGPAAEGAPDLIVRKLSAAAEEPAAYAAMRAAADQELGKSWRARSVVKEGDVTTGGGPAKLLVLHADVPESSAGEPSGASYYYYLLLPRGDRSWVLVGRTDSVPGDGDASVGPRHEAELLRAFASFAPPA